MISVIHTPVEDDEDFLIPAGGRRMEMDWDEVTSAFQNAVDHLGWNADLEIRPEKQYVMVRYPRDAIRLTVDGMSEFYHLVEDRLGVQRFMSIWIDFFPQD